MDQWPDCAFPGCHRKACLRVESRSCWPHTPGPTKLIEAQQIRRLLLSNLDMDDTHSAGRVKRRLSSRPAVFR